MKKMQYRSIYLQQFETRSFGESIFNSNTNKNIADKKQINFLTKTTNLNPLTVIDECFCFDTCLFCRMKFCPNNRYIKFS